MGSLARLLAKDRTAPQPPAGPLKCLTLSSFFIGMLRRNCHVRHIWRRVDEKSARAGKCQERQTDRHVGLPKAGFARGGSGGLLIACSLVNLGSSGAFPPRKGLHNYLN